MGRNRNKYVILPNETKAFGKDTDGNPIIGYRIQAVKDFGDIKKGDKGGYVQAYRCLAQNDESWLYDETVFVDCTSRVSGKSAIRGKVRIKYKTQIEDTDIYSGTDGVIIESIITSTSIHCVEECKILRSTIVNSLLTSDRILINLYSDVVKLEAVSHLISLNYVSIGPCQISHEDLIISNMDVCSNNAVASIDVLIDNERVKLSGCRGFIKPLYEEDGYNPYIAFYISSDNFGFSNDVLVSTYTDSRKYLDIPKKVGYLPLSCFIHSKNGNSAITYHRFTKRDLKNIKRGIKYLMKILNDNDYYVGKENVSDFSWIKNQKLRSQYRTLGEPEYVKNAREAYKRQRKWSNIDF